MTQKVLYIGAEWEYCELLKEAYAEYNARNAQPEFIRFDSIHEFVSAHIRATEEEKNAVGAIVIEERQRLFQVDELESDPHKISERFDINRIHQADKGAELACYVAKELAWENTKGLPTIIFTSFDDETPELLSELVKSGAVKHRNIFEENSLITMSGVIKAALQERIGINPAEDRSRGKPAEK